MANRKKAIQKNIKKNIEIKKHEDKNKEKVIKEVIDSYEGKIPEPFYSRLKEAMYNYKVEITD